MPDMHDLTRTSPSVADASHPSSRVDHGRFAPGAVLGNRYRMVELLGRGGMGEVYRADDLRLGVTVALKFLPAAVSEHATRLVEFLNEVRIARQVTHPNVCRVYDLDEADGHQFISMEYIDGESLASLLKRIGRLPTDKACELARQLCAGLSVAHDNGILHRDLKPANIMIDGRGRLRITDFGLAGLAADFRGQEVRAGTPAYMAPEQLAGAELTPRSDIYSLGLVLYEMFTGKRVFEGASVAEYSRLHNEEPPTHPSTYVDDLDPGIAEVILRCLAKDPAMRPGSALAVAAALPGGDPLAAALAAGETPSPEMVAAASKSGAVSPALGLLALGITLAGLLAIATINHRFHAARNVPLEMSPPVLVDHAREVVRAAGYSDRAADSDHKLTPDMSVGKFYVANLAQLDRWERLRDGRVPLVQFWYRQSPRPMSPLDVSGRVQWEDPPPTLPGMIGVVLNSRGQLRRFTAIPERTGPTDATREVDWKPLFDEAGLNIADFRPAAAVWRPPVYGDQRFAWDPAEPADRLTPVRVEAAAVAGKPVYFEVIGPWTAAAAGADEARMGDNTVAASVIVALLVIMMLAGVVLVWRNLRLGRGDRRGAFNVAIYLFSVAILAWLVTAHHVPSPTAAFGSFVRSLAGATFFAGFFWLLYMAVEPYVRRRWPHRIISWQRLLAGRWRDPLVGRDVLIGTMAGVLTALVGMLETPLTTLLGAPPGLPIGLASLATLELPDVIGMLLMTQPVAVFNGLFFLFLPFLLFLLVRREWLAGALFWLITTVTFALRAETFVGGLILSGVLCAVWVFVTLRFGLLAIVAQFFVLLMPLVPLTFDLAGWYAAAAILPLCVVLVLAGWGFRAALAGRPLLRTDLLDT